MRPTIVYLNAVELELARVNVLRAFWSDLGLVRHPEERQIVDVQNEGISLQIVVKSYLPIHLAVLKL